MKLKNIKIYIETKTTYEILYNKKILFFNLKILYFLSISVKCKHCRMKGFQKKSVTNLQTDLLIDKVTK